MSALMVRMSQHGRATRASGAMGGCHAVTGATCAVMPQGVGLGDMVSRGAGSHRWTVRVLGTADFQTVALKQSHLELCVAASGYYLHIDG